MLFLTRDSRASRLRRRGEKDGIAGFTVLKLHHAQREFTCANYRRSRDLPRQAVHPRAALSRANHSRISGRRRSVDDLWPSFPICNARISRRAWSFRGKCFRGCVEANGPAMVRKRPRCKAEGRSVSTKDTLRPDNAADGPFPDHPFGRHAFRLASAALLLAISFH